jgi:indole-3-glycerol phosphate synthase
VILDDILAAKAQEVARHRARCSAEALRARDLWEEPRRGFARAIGAASGRCIIAEIKRASPSRGTIRSDFDPARHAAEYDEAGATCVSVLTDTPYFGGSLEDLAAARPACALPLLRKDFIVDAYQVAEARAYGADAVLLIVAALPPTSLAELLEAAAGEGLDVLTEVHDERELEIALRSGATLIGVNNRNLNTFETSIDVTRRIAASVPAGVTLISESGLGDARELQELEERGVAGFLIGETFMAADDPGAKLAALLRG